MDGTRDLRLLLASRHPLIVARMEDETRFMSFARRAAELCGYPVWTWSVTLGLARDGNASQVDTQEPKKALAFVRQLQAPGVYVFHDLRPHLEDPVVVRHLKEFALAERAGQTILITGPDASVPHELEGVALPWTLEPPARDEIEPLIRSTIADLTQCGLAVALTETNVQEMVTACLGLTLPEIERLILRQAIDDQKLDAADVDGVARAKAELLADDGVLQLVPTWADLDAVGGLDELKRWLGLRARGFEPAAKDFGLEPPRGVLIAGVPGCGKSLTAKCVARSWSMPLVLLDPAAIYAMYVGESEERLRSALATVEAMAPVVLWIDEIEKGFAGGSSDADAGTARRVIGTFLRWLQERPPGVFLIATCNDVETLPSELLRRGRFDGDLLRRPAGPVGARGDLGPPPTAAPPRSGFLRSPRAVVGRRGIHRRRARGRRRGRPVPGLRGWPRRPERGSPRRDPSDHAAVRDASRIDRGGSARGPGAGQRRHPGRRAPPALPRISGRGTPDRIRA